jgi:hypothetical protein
MSKKSLLVYNICGIAKDNTLNYPVFMNAIKKQFETFNGTLKVVVSACLTKDHTLPYLKNNFPEFEYIYYPEKLPVNITFNKSVIESINRFGEFDNYTYLAADALLGDSTMESMSNTVYNNKNIGMYSAQIDNDSCYAYGLKLCGSRHVIDDECARYEMFKNGTDYIVPVGRACAAHCNMFSNDMVNFYGKCFPDIFASYCTESVFSFLVAAISKQWWISKDNLVKHFPSMDGPSSGFKPNDTDHRKNGFWDHPLFGDTIMPVFENEYAKSIGLGYEECANVVMHDPSQFDNNNFCINTKLKDYIKENLFLSKEIFNYDNIKCETL